MVVNTTPQFTITEAQRLAQEIYGLSAAASALPSERDQNFALRCVTGERFVLKIAKSDEEPAVLELQNALLRHAAERAPHLVLPRVIATSEGEDMNEIQGAGVTYLVRLLSWLEGDVFVRALPHTQTMLASLGAVLADLDRSLLDFSHPAMHRELYWDVKRADLALEHFGLLSQEQQGVVQPLMQAWRDVNWRDLRHSAIHGDANDYNVLVRAGSVVGLLDFGDTVHSAVVCDLAIALAYALLDEGDPLAAAVTIIRAYHHRFPLTVAEVEALYPLMAARLCMSLCYAAYHARVKPEDAYQLVTAGPGWMLLQHLAALPGGTAQSAFRLACERP
jgi:Ser/Thr protein kinase RdoA (MazF antagonist)